MARGAPPFNGGQWTTFATPAPVAELLGACCPPVTPVMVCEPLAVPLVCFMMPGAALMPHAKTCLEAAEVL